MTGLYRAGWPSRVAPRPRRAGWCWVWAGPWVIGWGWDRGQAREDGRHRA